MAAVGGPGLVAAVVAFLLMPTGIGGLAYVGVAVVGILGLVLGPALRRAEPRGPWRLMTVGGLFFLVGLALRLGVLPRNAGILESPDLWVVVGYLTTLCSLFGLLSSTAKGSGRLAAIDAMIVTSGAALGFFSAEVGPHLNTEADATLWAIALNVLYPVLDAVLLSFTVHLAFRTSRRSP